MKKKLISLFLVLFLVVGFTKVSAAEFPNTIEVKVGSKIQLLDYYLTHKYMPNDTDVYCIQFYKKTPSGTCNLMTTQWSQTTAAGVAAIMDSVTDGNHNQYYYADTAVNYLLGEYKGSATSNTQVKSYYNKAIKAQQTLKDFSVSASLASSDFTTQDGYYVSDKILVSLTSATSYTVSLNNPTAEVIEKTSSSFRVRVPVSDDETTTRVNATVSASYSYKTAAKYECSDATAQLVSPDILKTVTATKKATVALAVSKQSFRVKKMDSNKQALAGVELQILTSDGKPILDANDNVMYNWISTSSAYTVFGLLEGSYILKEVATPDGFEPLSSTIPFTVDSSGNVKLSKTNDESLVKDNIIYVYNKYKTKLKISKQDIANQKELPGATLQILDESGKELVDKDGKVIHKWVSTDTPYYVEGLPVGKYILVEKTAPKGYAVKTEKMPFELKADGKVVSLVMNNAALIEVPKTDFSISTIMIILGGVILLGGAGIVFINVKQKKLK